MKNKGITLVALTITIIILLIIAGISISVGKSMIKKANLEELKTNMLLIKTKGKEYVENANFKLGPNVETAEDKETRITNAKAELKGKELTNAEKEELTANNIINTTGDGEFTVYCDLTTNENENYLEQMGIKGLESNEENGKFIIKYEMKNMTVEVYNTVGYNGKYSLTDIDQIEE